MTKDPFEFIAGWLEQSQRIVAFTGAGISTESGIPDFRSPTGVWATNQPVYFDDFLSSPAARHEYWRQKAIAHQDFAAAQPNDGHAVLARWERLGNLQAVITQNIDGLHQAAGSQHVLELHGTAREVACLDCGIRYEADGMVQRFLAEGKPPDCVACGGLLKHATISFGQSLSQEVLEASLRLAQQADLFFAIGSSLVVQPAAGLPQLARQSGARLVIINREPTVQDSSADAVVRTSIGEALSELDARWEASRQACAEVSLSRVENHNQPPNKVPLDEP